ncbi:hypothetical protein NQZ68_019782 [Dissostichus eleginoides]|nr:hypothetical protein NQZ68_019782 [Dissostichus eleginoides]
MAYACPSDLYAQRRLGHQASRLPQISGTGQGHVTHICGRADRGLTGLPRKTPWKSVDACGYTVSGHNEVSVCSI